MKSSPGRETYPQDYVINLKLLKHFIQTENFTKKWTILLENVKIQKYSRETTKVGKRTRMN